MGISKFSIRGLRYFTFKLRCFVEMKNIHEGTKFAGKYYRGTRNDAKYKTMRFILFSLCLDCFQNIFTFWTLQGTMNERVHVYSIFPVEWKSPFLENIFWLLESFNIVVLFNVISMMTTLPGVWGYYIEESLRKMTCVVEYEIEKLVNGEEEAFKGSKVVESMMEHYRNLFWGVREIIKRMGWGAMSFNTTNCIQQTAETYVIFQCLKAGAGFADVQFMLTDILVR